jgi:hypothetical protein
MVVLKKYLFVFKIYYLDLLRASEGTLSRWSRLHLQSLVLTNPHWARVVGYGPFSLCVIHKEGLCPSSGDILGIMMMVEFALFIPIHHHLPINVLIAGALTLLWIEL